MHDLKSLVNIHYRHISYLVSSAEEFTYSSSHSTSVNCTLSSGHHIGDGCIRKKTCKLRD